MSSEDVYPPNPGPMPDLLTADEKKAVDLLGDIDDLLQDSIIADGNNRDFDIDRADAHLSALQEMILSNAAGRAYPGSYNVLGHDHGLSSH